MMMRNTLLAMALMTTAGMASLGALAAPPAGAGNPPTPVPLGAQYGQPRRECRRGLAAVPVVLAATVRVLPRQ